MTWLGDFPEDFASVVCMFTTHAGDGSPVAPLSAFENADVRIYKNGSSTEKTSQNGVTMTSPFDSVTGLHALTIDTSNDTGDSGFWVAGAVYTLVLSPDETVDGKAVAKVIGQFGLNLASVLRPTTAGRTVDVDANGGVEVGSFQTGAITAAAIAADAITDAKVAADVTIASVTGAVGSVTGNVGGNVTGSVGSVATGGITAASIATDAIGAAELAADAVTEIATGVWAAAARTLTANTNLNDLNAAGIRAAVGLASANLDTQIGTLATASALATVASYVDTEVAAIKAKTDNLPSDPADASDIAAAFSTVNGTLATIAGYIDTEVAAIYSRIGAPAGASISADIAAVKTQTAAIEVDTQDVQTRMPAALISGRLDVTVGAMQANVMTAAAAAADLTTELQTGLATSAAVAVVQAKTDNLPSDPADQSLIIGATDAILAAIPSAAGNASALLAAAFEGAETVQDFLRLARAALYGKASGLATSTARFRNASDGKDRIVATVDADGNRSTVTLDAS